MTFTLNLFKPALAAACLTMAACGGSERHRRRHRCLDRQSNRGGCGICEWNDHSVGNADHRWQRECLDRNRRRRL
jgi:hypothetical protein